MTPYQPLGYPAILCAFYYTFRLQELGEKFFEKKPALGWV